MPASHVTQTQKKALPAHKPMTIEFQVKTQFLSHQSYGLKLVITELLHNNGIFNLNCNYILPVYWLPRMCRIYCLNKTCKAIQQNGWAIYSSRYSCWNAKKEPCILEKIPVGGTKKDVSKRKK